MRLEPGLLIIPAKCRPPLPGPHLARERLLHRLREGLHRRLTLVVAGPGFGKTLLLAGFAREVALPAVWYQADAADGDLVRFLWHLLRGVEELLPGGLPGIRELLSSPAMPLRDPEAAVATLITDLLREDTEGLVLCIDDWHLIPPGSATSTLLQRLIPYLPDHVHLYLAGRNRGDLPVERWKLQGWLGEITADDLRFDDQEAMEVLRQVHGLEWPEGTEPAEVRQAEGWAVGIYLLGRSRRLGGAPPASPLAPEQALALSAYLDSEVMEQLPAARRDFLLETAVLEDLPVPLCDALRDAGDSAQHLAALAADGLFTYRVDPVRPAYRYHSLFREYLLARLPERRGAEAVAGQHRRAAACLKESGDLLGAMRHLLAAGETVPAAGLLEDMGESALWVHSLTIVASWLRQLPAALLETRPRLLLLTADMEQWEGKLDLAAAHLEQAAALFHGRAEWAGQADAEARLSHIYLLRDDAAGARRWIEGAIARIPAGADRTRAVCLVRLALVEWMEGRLERCEPLLREAHALFERLGDRLGEAWALHNLAIDVHVARGELQAAAAAFHQVADLCAGTTSRLHCTCLLNLGSTLGFLGRHAEGRGYLQRALDMAGALAFEAGRGYALAYLGWVAAATGDTATAASCVQEARQIEARVTDPQLRLEALAAEALLHRRRGDLVQALESGRQHLVWAHSTRNPFYLATTWSQLVLIHVGRREWDDARRAMAQMRELLAAHPTHHTRFQARLSEAVLALALPAEVPAGPVPALAELLTLVMEEGYEGLFLAEGEWALRLLKAADAAGIAPAAVSHLRARWPQPAQTAAGAAPLAPAAAAPEPRLRICLFGDFTLTLDGQPLPENAWRGHKPRELCKLLALHLGTPLSLDRCLDALWPQLDREAAHRNFRVTLHWLRRALGSDLVTYADGRCALESAATWCDVAEFRRLLPAAAERWRAGDAAGAATLYELCVALYRGDLLAGDPLGDWQLPTHDELREGYLGALTRLVVCQARAGEREQAIVSARRIIALDPLREPAYRLLMRLLASSGQRSEVVRIYRLCEESLRRELGVQPSAATRGLFDRLALLPE